MSQRLRKCGICREAGHNRSTCPTASNAKVNQMLELATESGFPVCADIREKSPVIEDVSLYSSNNDKKESIIVDQKPQAYDDSNFFSSVSSWGDLFPSEQVVQEEIEEKPLRPDEIPFDIHPDVFSAFEVYSFFNPKSDGWCGWRALARHWMGDEDLFPFMKRQMIETFLRNKSVYLDSMDFDCEVGYSIKSGRKRRLGLTTEEVLRAGSDDLQLIDCDVELWFESPRFAQITADFLHCPVLVYPELNGPNKGVVPLSFLPLSVDPYCWPDKGVKSPLILQRVNGNHWILLYVKTKNNNATWPSIYGRWCDYSPALATYEEHWKYCGNFPDPAKINQGSVNTATFIGCSDEE